MIDRLLTCGKRRPASSRAGKGIWDVHGQNVGNVFTGIDVDVAIRNSNAIMHRVSYQITIIGKIAFFVTR